MFVESELGETDNDSLRQTTIGGVEMNGELSNEPQQKVPDLRMLWLLLTEREQLEFWKYAGQYAKDFKHNSEPYRYLCAAIKAADAGKTAGRSPLPIPRTARLLSAEDARSGITRLKTRLLDQLSAQSFLNLAFCNWIQDSCTETLNAVLDAVNCPHDERGTLIGDLPSFSPEEATKEILALARLHSPRTLAVVCGGLMLNRNLWNGLAAVFGLLQEMEEPVSEIEPVATSSSSQSSEVDVRDNAASPKSTAAMADALQGIRVGLDLLFRHLTDATADAAAGYVPDLATAIECWTTISKQQKDAVAFLGVSSRSILDLEAAYARQSAAAQTLSELKRCDTIVHVSDPSFAGCEVIREKCAALELVALSEHTLDNASFRPVAALLKLVESGSSLDDEQAAQLQSEVESLFGWPVATAAVRGKLAFDVSVPQVREAGDATTKPASAVPPQTEEQDLEQVSPSISAEIEAPAADPSPYPQKAEVQDAASDQNVHKANFGSEPDLRGHISYSESKLAAVPAPYPSVDALVAADEGPYEEVIEGVGAESSRVESEDQMVSAFDYEPYETFRRSHWVNASGSVEPAPWRREGYASGLARRALGAWDAGHMAIAYLFFRGAAAFGEATQIAIEDLASADHLLSDPSSHSAGIDIGRVARLRSCLSNMGGDKQKRIGLALMLEALRPGYPCSYTKPEIDALIDRASYNDPALNEIVQFLLVGWSAELNPVISLRDRLLDAPVEPVEVVEADLQLAQKDLRAKVAALWSAAGGKIKHTHCRNAWNKFIQNEVVPLRDELAPNDSKTKAKIKLSPEQTRERVIGLARSFRRIMDFEHVKHLDRSAAEGGAQQIVEAMDVVADARQRLESQRQRSKSSYDGIPHEAGARLLSATPSNAIDRVCALLFAAVLSNKSLSNPLRLKAGYLINHVDAIRYLDPNALSKPGVARDGLNVLAFSEPAAVSELMEGWHQQDPSSIEEDNDLWVSLRNVAADRLRYDILAALSSTDVLQSHERTLLHRFALELDDRTFEATRELERLWGACNELMAPNEASLRGVVEEAKNLKATSSISIASSKIQLEWLRQGVALARKHKAIAAQTLLEHAVEKPESVASQIATYFEAGDYRAGVALFHGGTVPKSVGDRLGVRRTMWREDARKTWLEPRTKLANDLRGSTQEQNRLVELWTSGTADPGQRDAMPKLLYSVISGEAGRSLSENQKRFPVKLVDLREHKDRKSTFNCETVRAYFQKSKLNPTFLPQLATFSQIVIAPSPQQASRSTSILDDWCKAAGNEIPNSLVVFLAPGLALSRRDELCAGLRKRGVPAAIIDDIDMCRLCAASTRMDGHDFVPFLEVLFEQLDLDRASPFSSLDGQHVRLETYIGRKHDAEKIALDWTYTRVFSGRKLGKSALLKYVADTFDNSLLPSGNTLNVFFITIAGGESERWVVDCIVDEMTNRFSLPEKLAATERPPAVRFSEYMKRFLQEKPKHSVLLILDEADAFVEGQLARYDEDQEGSLSFRMMKELPAQVDSSQLPRIRTIFSGYRVTNTRGGVWANAGDVLVLRPLAEEEAVQFLEGMLARIGIALGTHAPFVAMRCGFQPAVLIRFGESLVRRLKRSNRSADRETLTVSHEEVLATLGEQGVLDEIRTVVSNNFQGNRIGAVVFGATLLALKDLEPGLALTNGPAQVLAKLREIDPDSDWLEKIDTSPLAEIERNLQDFIDRKLLTVSDSLRFGVREYRLRFPHFLPVLTQQSEVALEVRQQIQAIRAGASQRRLYECVLSESALDTIRYWYRQNDSRDCKLIIVGGHWTECLLDAKRGVPDRLGCERGAISMTTKPEEAVHQIKAKVQIFGNVSEHLWETFLEADAAQPLVLIGGLDLQRRARRYALEGGQVPVEVVALGRLTEGTLAWWLEDARALHFTASDAIARIAVATGLVPFLVGAFDALLQHAPGSEVTEKDLSTLLASFDDKIPEYASNLTDPAFRGSLTLREVELLQMAVQVSGAGEFDIEKEFQEYWSILENRSVVVAPFGNPEDWSALKMLVEVGLLPAHTNADSAASAQSLGRVRFDPSSVLVQLIKALGSQSAA